MINVGVYIVDKTCHGGAWIYYVDITCNNRPVKHYTFYRNLHERVWRSVDCNDTCKTRKEMMETLASIAFPDNDNIYLYGV